MTTPAPITCYRCGQPGHTNWVNITSWLDTEPQYRAGEQYCTTAGCTDLDGSRRLVPLTPAELRARADKAWMATQERMVSER